MSTIKADSITAVTTNTPVSITGAGTGKVRLGDANLLWPDADGSADQALVTDGSGTLSFATAGGGAVAWYTNIAVFEYANDYFNGGSSGSVPNTTGPSSGAYTYTLPATELFVMVIGGGGNSHAATQGGTTSFGSHVTATGGQGSTAYATNSYQQSIGGIGASGDINIRGNMGGSSTSTNVPANPNNPGPMFGGTGYGHGGGGGSTHTGWGAAGGYAQKRLTGLTIGATVTITVSNFLWDGGYDSTYMSHQGGQGVCIVMY